MKIIQMVLIDLIMKKGYTFHNSNACCGECNIMKKEMDYSIFMDKLKSIHKNCLKKEMKPPSICVVNILNHNKNKLNSDERRAISQLKKQAIRLEIVECSEDL